MIKTRAYAKVIMMGTQDDIGMRPTMKDVAVGHQKIALTC